MDLEIAGVDLTLERDAGTGRVYRFSVFVGSERELVDVMLAGMPTGSELSVPDPDVGDCSLEVRRGNWQWEAKRGCHGANGTWRPLESKSAAIDWLLPGAQYAARAARSGYGGVLWVPK